MFVIYLPPHDAWFRFYRQPPELCETSNSVNKLAKVYIFTYCGILICRETWVSQFRIFTTAWGSESARRRCHYLVVFTGMV